MSGEVPVAIAALTGAVPFVREGRLRALVIGSEKRVSQLPDVPTIGEAGGGNTILPQYYALAAPAGTPPAVVERLNSELKRVLAMPDVADGAAILFNPHSTPEMTRAMADLLRDAELRSRMERLGQQRAAQFSWLQSARKTLEVYYAVAERSRRCQQLSMHASVSSR